jgi:crotonobetainyl-CoA:carnitine CoA-transferase CaiB-like acyl-CoA transferase
VSRQLIRANEPNPDPNTAVVVASAALLGLLARERHGAGQAIYVDMLAANAYANGDDFLDYAGKTERRSVDAELFGLGATYRLYPASNGWVFLALTTEAEWQRFCEVGDATDLRDDARFGTLEKRRAHDAALGELLAEYFRTRDAEEWEERFVSEGVGCVRADRTNPGAFWANDPHVIENGFSPLCQHARFGKNRRWGPLVTVGGLKPSYAAGVLAGFNTDAILTELGRSTEEILRLRAKRVVASEPVELDGAS